LISSRDNYDDHLISILVRFLLTMLRNVGIFPLSVRSQECLINQYLRYVDRIVFVS